MEIRTNVTEELANAKELLNILQRIEDTVSKIQREAEFYTISDISRLNAHQQAESTGNLSTLRLSGYRLRQRKACA